VRALLLFEGELIEVVLMHVAVLFRPGKKRTHANQVLVHGVDREGIGGLHGQHLRDGFIPVEGGSYSDSLEA
jgi:hypothetical protein